MFETDHSGRDQAGGLLGGLPFGRGAEPVAPRGNRVRTVRVERKMTVR